MNPLFIFTSPAKEQWLTEYFKLERYEHEFSKVKGSATEFFQAQDEIRNIIIYSTLLNAKNLPRNYVKLLLEDLSDDQVDMHVHGSPYGKAGNEYYSSFSRKIHIKPCRAIEGYPVHLGLDFNVNPYMPAVVCQVLPKNNGGYVATFFKEYTLKKPRNTIEHICRTFIKDYDHLFKYGLFFYGDASGKNSMPIEAYKNYFEIVEHQLRRYITRSSRRLLTANPRHKTVKKHSLGRRDFMNKILRGGYDVDIVIDPSCIHTIQDLEFIKEDANGAKKKDKVTEGGITFEKLGHLSDAIDSIICYIFGNYNREK